MKRISLDRKTELQIHLKAMLITCSIITWVILTKIYAEFLIDKVYAASLIVAFMIGLIDWEK